MKNRFKIIGLLTFCFVAFFSCKKDEVKMMATDGTTPALKANATKLNFKESDSATNAVSFTWEKSDYGYPAAVSYFLQFSFKDSSFRKTTEIAMGPLLSKSYKVSDFNQLMLGLKFSPGEVSKVYVRVRSQITNEVFKYSDSVVIEATAYRAERVIPYPNLFVPGAYQNWKPDVAPIAKLYSVNKDKNYAGYINLPDGTNYFKITPLANWDNSYGMVSVTNNAGTMTLNGGDNFVVTGNGYYLFKANIETGNWSATLNNWGIIGDAANGWGDNDDIMFDFDVTEQVLTKTVTLKPGGMKFRANRSWDLNIGDKGNNIAIDKPGVYKITLDLRVPDDVVYSVEAQ